MLSTHLARPKLVISILTTLLNGVAHALCSWSTAGILLLGPQVLADQIVQPLAGTWRFSLDRQDLGIHERWFEQRLPDRIQLPGSLPDQGIGDLITTNTPWTGGIVDRSFFEAPEFARYREPGHVRVPFWLQPERYYTGAAWFQCDFDLSPAWSDKRLILYLERPHWETRVWVGHQLIGTNVSLSTPHVYELGKLSSGRHTLTIRVDNRLVIDVGRDSHSVSDHTQGNWNGLVGALEIRALPFGGLEDLKVFPNVRASSLAVRGRVSRGAGSREDRTIHLEVTGKNGKRIGHHVLALPPTGAEGTSIGDAFDATIPCASFEPWDEFQPAISVLTATLEVRGQQVDQQRVRFGFREFATEGTRFVINGRSTFLRGTLECCIFPKTGHPPTDAASWRRIITIAKAHGLNNLRFHSWCPPEAAFQAADELGMYLHVECASWANASTTLGDGHPVDTWIYEEANRILEFYGNHPSFVMMLYGNEPGGKHHEEFLRGWVSHFKNADPRRLYSSAAGWPQIPQNDFHVTPDPRIQAWGGGLASRINGLPPATQADYREYIASRNVPVVSHEIGQWCVYPNFEEIKKYTGYLKPRNFEIFRETLAAHQMSGQAKDFLLASGKLQALCYKEDIESALRTPGMGGFQLLDLHDFPGQGTALVGVLDPFWDEKGYVTAAQFHRFCGPTVPLVRWPKHVFQQDEKATVTVEAAHFGPRRLEQVLPQFQWVSDRGGSFGKGQLPTQPLEIGNGRSMGAIELDFANLPAPARYRFVLRLVDGSSDRMAYGENDWDIWVYPKQVPIAFPQDLTVVHTLDDHAARTLQAGGKVLWLLPPKEVAPDTHLGPVALGFSSIFWNTAWTKRQPPHTLGILCDRRHPCFAAFPTDNYSNWQWWYLVNRAGAMILDNLSPDHLPIVQVIDDWFTARKLGLVFEARVGTGRLLVCSIDLEKDANTDLVVRQFRSSLLRYMDSAAFRPEHEVPWERVQALRRASD